VGQDVKIVVRPENLIILRADAENNFKNTVKGKLNDSMIIGGSVKHIINISQVDGVDEEIVVQEFNRSDRNSLRQGSEVTVCWNEGELLIFPIDER
jgi:hypothetical protein